VFVYLIPALFFGWSLGANDAANIFGPPVSSQLVKYRTAVLLSGLFIVIGALLQGGNGMETVRSVSAYSWVSGSMSVLAAAITMTIMTFLKVPVSSSQAIIGAIIGMNIFGNNSVNWSVLLKVVAAWVGTPLGGMLFGFISHKSFSPLFNKIGSIVMQERIMKIMALIIGCYGSYALGANNVANITGVFVNQIGVEAATLIGGVAIALGVITFSRRVMFTVGKKITPLDPFSSMIAILGESLTVWVYALIGIPVSTSQAVVGSVLGTSLAAGHGSISKKQVLKIVIAWINTPLSAGLIAVGLALLLKLFGITF